MKDAYAYIKLLSFGKFWPSPFTFGSGPVTVELHVANDGDEKIGPMCVGWLFKNNTHVQVNGKPIFPLQEVPLAPGTTWKHALPPIDGDGSYKVMFVADWAPFKGGVIKEVDESNNVAKASFNIVPAI